MPATSNSKAPKIGVVIPCFRETNHILDVIKGIGKEVSVIFVIDDCCPDKTGEFVIENCKDKRVHVTICEQNSGVGGATVTGYQKALEAGIDIVVKMDGDGQMDANLIRVLIKPVLDGEADYAKGNRFYDLNGLKQMPTTRIIGNLGLSFMTKFSSGYWNVFDPTNGFTAIHAEALRRLPLDKIAKTYFFESDMLFHLNTIRATVADVPMAARYGSEQSSMSISKILLEFPPKHYKNACLRIFYSYFLRDFSIASVELVLGKLMLLFGFVFGGYHWHRSLSDGIPATAGTVILAALPILIGVQLLLAFLNYDIKNVPDKPLQKS